MKSFKMILSIIAISIGLSYISSSSAADALPLTLVSETNTTITLGWTPQSGYGYLFFNKCDANLQNCTLVSRTNDPSRNTVKFAKGNNYYKVSVIVEGNSGGYPPVAPPPPPPPDTTPPTNPSGLNVTNVTDTSLTFNWSASTDNVAVTGYDVFRNSVKVATTTLLNSPMSGLNCATTYTLGVQAFDGAGNKSSVVSTNATTSACSPPTSYTANVYLSSTSGSASCVRSATKINYSTASANGNVCNSWQAACSAATGGDEVGVKANTTSTPFLEGTPSAAATYINGDCSKGLGNDVDPTILPVGTNPMDVISNWVTFECADGPARDSVIMDVKYFTPNGNNHMYVNGSCFLFGTIEGGMGGASGLTTQNFIFDGVHLQGFQINGARNVWLRNIELGPVVLCYQDGSGVPESQQCDSSGSLIGYLEHRWANRSGGSSDLQTQGRVNPNRDTHSQNVLVENVWWHDSQSKESVALHSGCGFVLDNQSADTNNVIYRNGVCERVVHQGMYVSDSSGVTMENWQIGCPVEPLDNVGEANWGVTNCNQRAFHINCAIACSNLLYRFNSSLSAVDLINNAEVGANVRVVANIANTFNCPSDVAGGYNVRSGAGVGCGTNNTTYSTSPFVDTNQSPTPTSSPSIDMHLSGSPGSFPFENTVTPNTGDYDLSKDMDLETRSGDPGADSR